MIYPDLMVDLETLDNCPSAVVLSIGVVAFDANDPSVTRKHYHVHLHADDQRRVGRTIGADTVLWWLQQGAGARADLVAGQDEPDLPAFALHDLAMFIKEHTNPDKVRVWGNGAGFDEPILASMYRSYNMPLPWEFYNSRCLRTLKALFKPKFRLPEDQKHNALNDAIAQVEQLLEIVGTYKMVIA